MGRHMLKSSRSSFKDVSVARTLCPACAQRIEHPANYVVSVMRAEGSRTIVTRLVANELLVIHACETSPEADTADGATM